MRRSASIRPRRRRCHLPGRGRFQARNPGHEPIAPGSSIYIHGYSGGAQTHWLEATLAAARDDTSIDWIIVLMHQDALTSSKNGNGSDRGGKRRAVTTTITVRCFRTRRRCPEAQPLTGG